MVCRLCFSQSDDYTDIFSEEKISKYIKKFLELEITKHDPVSKVICGLCWQELKAFQNFYMRVKEAQRSPHIKFKKESSAVEKDLEQMEESTFEYVNTKTDDLDLNDTSEIIQNEDELAEPIVPDNNDIKTTTDIVPIHLKKRSRHSKKLSKTTRSFKNEGERKFFVELMKKEEVIWNRTHTLHSSSRALTEAWKRISLSMLTPKTVHECKVMWKSLRDALRYERRKAASGFDQGHDLRNLLYFVSPSNGQRKVKSTTVSPTKSTESPSKNTGKCKVETRKKYKIQNYHLFDGATAAWSERTCEGSVSDMSAYSEGPSKHFSNNVSFEANTDIPHSTASVFTNRQSAAGVFTIASAPAPNVNMDIINEPPPVFYSEVKSEFKDEVSDLVESISKALNRLVTIATTQIHMKSNTIEFKYEYIWKLIECLYAQMDQTTINDLNQRIINMVYEDDYADSYQTHSDFENTSIAPIEFNSGSESNNPSTLRRGAHIDDEDNENINATNKKKRKLDNSGLEDLILKVHAENKALLDHVTREILCIKADVKKIQADLTFQQNDTVINSDRYPFTKKLPFKDRESILRFENECAEDPVLLQTLQSFYKHADPSNSKAFLRNNIKKIITDEAAVMFSWQGTDQKTQMKNLYIFDALRTAFREVFPKSSEMFANTILKRHFQHASDRIKKRRASDAIM